MIGSLGPAANVNACSLSCGRRLSTELKHGNGNDEDEEDFPFVANI